jgi:pectinesterase
MNIFKIVGVLSLILCFHFLKASDKLLVTVAVDGSGDFTSIQAAIDATKAFPDERMTIFVKNGVYNEKVKVHNCNDKLTIKGEDALKTIVRFDDHFNKINRGRNSTFHTATFLVQANGFIAENLSFENTSGPVGQAIALAVEADRCIFRNCRIVGDQDALYAAGENCRQYYSNCYIEGTTDYIFGQATALFENCTLHSKSNSFITAASTPKGADFGFVFLNCKLTANEGTNSVYMGRPWRSYAKTVFISCYLGKHIRQEGWHPWTVGSGREKTAFYAEYNNFGEGASTNNRASWSHQLTKKEAKKYTPAQILKGRLPFDEPNWFK